MLSGYEHVDWDVAVCSSNSGSDSHAHQSSRWVMDFTNDSEDTVMKLYYISPLKHSFSLIANLGFVS
jgi:hypothetical protein